MIGADVVRVEAEEAVVYTPSSLMAIVGPVEAMDLGEGGKLL